MARPENAIRLTCIGREPARVVDGMAKLRQWWRRYVGAWEDVYAIEANPRGGGLHLHGWQYGSPVDRGDLERAAEVSGFLPGPYGKPRRVPDAAPLSYFLKTAIYPPATTMPDHAEQFLLLNKSLVHKSRGFWRDWRDQPLRTMREAVTTARRGRRGIWVTTSDG